MPTDLALNRCARQDARLSDLALRDRGDDTAVDPAGVANGREAGVECRAGRGEDVRRDLGGACLKREVRLDRAQLAQADMSVDQAARHRQSLGIQTLAVRARGTESGDAAALDGDVDAARIETSHALLRYHFGALSGVLAAMLNAQRSRDNEALLEAAQQGTFDDFVVAIWRTYTRPDQLLRARGFFYVAGLGGVRPRGLP
ncbi:hypothetical protein ACFWGI_35310 [Streptomyces niveus]|uniref:hypothetical protein n=1 Tax=Streptomyces niveus TaxID=193462 RepID=UPI003660E33C